LELVQAGQWGTPGDEIPKGVIYPLGNQIYQEAKCPKLNITLP
jgi:hypothetical protein